MRGRQRFSPSIRSSTRPNDPLITLRRRKYLGFSRPCQHELFVVPKNQLQIGFAIHGLEPRRVFSFMYDQAAESARASAWLRQVGNAASSKRSSWLGAVMGLDL